MENVGWYGWYRDWWIVQGWRKDSVQSELWAIIQHDTGKRLELVLGRG